MSETTTTAPEGTTPPQGTEPPNDAQGNGPATPPEGDPETFSRDYVQKLRDEAAEARVRGARADDLATRLFDQVFQTEAAKHLRDWRDLPHEDQAYYLDEQGLPDAERIEQAAKALAQERPHLARVRGDAGQGARTTPEEAFSLAGALRAAAG